MSSVIGLDIGDARIGVATANIFARVAHPYAAYKVDGSEIETLQALIHEIEANLLVVGLPRNMDGLETAQTEKVRDMARSLEKSLGLAVIFQDESLTSVEAERRLETRKKPYTRGDIDMEAAAIILQDYLDSVATS